MTIHTLPATAVSATPQARSFSAPLPPRFFEILTALGKPSETFPAD